MENSTYNCSGTFKTVPLAQTSGSEHSTSLCGIAPFSKRQARSTDLPMYKNGPPHLKRLGGKSGASVDYQHTPQAICARATHRLASVAQTSAGRVRDGR